MDKIKAYLFTDNKRMREILSLYFEELNFIDLDVSITKFSSLYNEITSIDKCILFADTDCLQLENVKSLYQDAPNAIIVVITDNPDTNFIISAVKSGAKDVLAYPILKTEFLDTINKIKTEFYHTNKNECKCKTITVYSNKGGIGKTSIAANLAYELAKFTKENVALIDFNFQFGDITTFMDLHPTFNTAYMFENLNILNKDFLLSTMEQYKDTSLYVLADTPYLTNKNTVSQKQITKLIEALKSCFSYIIIDTDSSINEKTITTLDKSDIVLMVTIVNMPALRNSQRCLELFEKMGYSDEKVQILINRYMENDEITIKDVEKVLGKKVYWKIPNNYFALMSAINKGILLSEVNPTSNVSTSYKELALKISNSVYQNNISNKFRQKNLIEYNNTLER